MGVENNREKPEKPTTQSLVLPAEKQVLQKYKDGIFEQMKGASTQLEQKIIKASDAIFDPKKLEIDEEGAKQRANYISQYLEGKTYTIVRNPNKKNQETMTYTVPNYVAKAIAGNAYQESRCKINAKDGAGAFGFFQILFPARQGACREYIKNHSQKPIRQNQLDFIFSDNSMKNGKDSISRATAQALILSKNIASATKAFCDEYESPNPLKANIAKRIQYAQGIETKPSTRIS